MRKGVQRRVYSFLGTKVGLAFCVLGMFFTLNTTMQLAATVLQLQWSHSSAGPPSSSWPGAHWPYDGPIDVVYTWVNGSDPLHQQALAAAKAELERELMGALNDTTRATVTSPDHANDTSTANRFHDNEELRYSLRSLLRHAPWVRNIYLVTNGQIPHWLRLDHPRLRVVTHHQLFPNASHLPTFSSPAIEAHLHRVPGLSPRFLYFNDDVMLGRDVWPSDFFTRGQGFRVYLSWNVPDCAEGCPANWPGDGYCDRACNCSACDWDGGDCANVTSTTGSYAHRGVRHAGTTGGRWFQQSAQVNAARLRYCAPACPDHWIGDRYCDRACRNVACGWDAGDCGADVMLEDDTFLGVPIVDEEVVDTLHLPRGVESLYFNLTTLVGNGTIEDGTHDNPDLVRTATIHQTLKIMTLTLHRNQARSNVSLLVQWSGGGSVRWNMTADTTQLEANNGTMAAGANGTNDATTANATATPTPTPSPTPAPTPGSTIVTKITTTTVTSTTPMPNPASPDPKSAPTKSMESLPRVGNHSTGRHLLQWSPRAASMRERALVAQRRAALHARTASVETVSDVFAASLQESDAREYDEVHLPGCDVRGNDCGADSGGSKKVPIREWREEEGYHPMGLGERLGTTVFPWQRVPVRVVKRRGHGQRPHGRQLLDIYGDSLKHVNRLYNRAFSVAPRKVPAHMPHFVDGPILERLQQRFPTQWDATSARRFRHPSDMQFAFAYFYWLINERQEWSDDRIWHYLDRDASGDLSVNEIRTAVALVRTLPLEEEDVRTQTLALQGNHSIVTKEHLFTWHEAPALRSHFNGLPLHPHVIEGTDEVAFIMVHTNDSTLPGKLDGVRQRRHKFICLNDNLDHDDPNTPEAKRALLDLMHWLYPNASELELPPSAYHSEPLYIHAHPERTPLLVSDGAGGERDPFTSWWLRWPSFLVMDVAFLVAVAVVSVVCSLCGA